MFAYEREKAVLLVYTRTPDAASYPDGLAHSIHLACSRDGVQRV